jgi:hypothetical protein
MEGKAGRLRKAVQGLGRTRRNEAVPRSLRRELVGYAVAQRRAGRAWRSIAAELGVSGSSLQRWSASEPGEAPAMRRVALRQGAAPRAPGRGEGSGRLVLVTAGGQRVEGLAVAEALTLLRALGG